MEEVAWMRKRRRVKGRRSEEEAPVPFEENSRGFTGCPDVYDSHDVFLYFTSGRGFPSSGFQTTNVLSLALFFFFSFFPLVRSSFLSLRVVPVAKVRRVSRGTRGALVRTSAICRVDISLYRSISGSRRMRERRPRIYSVRSLFLFLALSPSFSLSSLYRRWFILLHFLKNFLKMLLTFSLFFFFFFYSETGST